MHVLFQQPNIVFFCVHQGFGPEIECSQVGGACQALPGIHVQVQYILYLGHVLGILSRRLAEPK